MAFIKRRPFQPNRPASPDGGQDTPRRKPRSKTDDYQSADGPQGRVVYKRGGQKPETDRGRGGPGRPFSPRPGPGRPFSPRPGPGRPFAQRPGPGRPFAQRPAPGRPWQSDDAPKGERPFGKAPGGHGRTGQENEESRPGRPFAKAAPRFSPKGPAMPSRAHGGPAPRPGKPALKPSQVHALTAIVDRELPNALKRLSEAEDRCLSAATNLLDQASSLDGFGEVLGLLSGLESVAADERATRHLSSLADIARKASETINLEASFGDLIGQRIIKISEFLETVQVILQEILEEHSAPKKAPAPRTGPGKWAQREPGPGPARPRGKGAWAAREPEDGPLPEDDRDGGHPGDRPRAAKRARPDGPVKRPREKADPPRGDDSFGPDDEGLDQEEVNDLIKKLGPRS